MPLPTWRFITCLKFSCSALLAHAASASARSAAGLSRLKRLRLHNERVRLALEGLRAAGLRERLGHLLYHLVELDAALLEERRARRAAHLAGGEGARARRLDLDLHVVDAHVAEARLVEVAPDRGLVVEPIRNLRELHLRIAREHAFHHRGGGLRVRVELETLPGVEQQRPALEQHAPRLAEEPCLLGHEHDA